MSEPERDGLGRLLEDLESADWPAPELLARYVREPNALEEAERLAVERAMAAHPAIADELDTLRGFDFARLDADRQAGAAQSGWLGALAWLRRPAVAWALVAAAALGLWLALGGDPDPTAPAPTPDLVMPNAPDSGALPDGDTSPRPDPRERAIPTPEAPRLAERPESGGPAPGTSEAPTPAIPAPDLETSPATQLAAAGDAAPTPGTSPSAGAPDAANEGTPDRVSPPAPSTRPEPTPEPEMLLAMHVPDYRPAFGLAMPGESSSGALRGGEGAGWLRVVSPAHRTRVDAASPPLFWSTDRVPETGAFYLTLLDREEEALVLDRRLPAPASQGLQRVDLATLGVTLPPGEDLRWSIAYRPDEDSPPAAFDFGWLRRAPLDLEAADRLAGLPVHERSAFLAAAGCYNEALAVALAERDAAPDDPSRRDAVERLLSVGAE